MKKILSVLLSVILIIGTMTVLMSLPTTAAPAENLIYHGDAEGVMVDDGNGGTVLKQKYTAEDVATSEYAGQIFENNLLGWRTCSTKYGNVIPQKVSDITGVPSGYFKNYSGEYAIRLHTNMQLLQDIELEMGKVYKVSAKVTTYPNTIEASNRFFDMFIDNLEGCTENYNLPSGTDWNLATGHAEVMKSITDRFNNPTAVSTGSATKGVGDFMEYSFTFKAKDFIKEYNLVANKNGNYDARFVVHNRTGYILLLDDVSIVEVDAASAAEISAEKGGYVKGELKTDGTESTITAVPYYGNAFLGWYDDEDKLVSQDATYTAVIEDSLTAKFDRRNLIDDGDFESGDPETLTKYENYPNYTGNAPGVIEMDNPEIIERTGAEYGEKALSLTPNQGNSNDKIKDLFSIPVSVEAGKTYIWRFSYAFPNVGYDYSKHYLQFSVDKAVGGDPIGWGGTVEYAWHAQKSSMPDIDTNSNTWSKNTPANKDAAARNYNGSAAGEWVYMYVIFTADTTDTYHLTIGTPATAKDRFLIDNVSCTESTQTIAPTAVTVEGEGTVSADETIIPAYRATQHNSAYQTVFQTREPNPYYSQMYVTYRAEPARGYMLDGWYNAEGVKVSNELDFLARSVGGTYTAKFVIDTNKYVVDAVVENVNGIKGGYVTDDITGGEYYNGEVVNLEAHAYKGNSFLGWYDEDGKQLSGKTVYAHTIKENMTITAKFECNNLFSDSGYENLDGSTDLWGADKEWYAAGATDSMDAFVFTADSFDGNKALTISAPNVDITSSAMAVEAGKTYHLAFDWRTTMAFADSETALKKVQVLNAADNTVVAEYTTLTEALGDAGWQQFHMNFSTGAATQVKVVLHYQSTTARLFLDNVTLYDTAKQSFIINAEMEITDDIYPGILTCAPTQTAQYNDNVTVSVEGYERNVFLGWYQNGVLKSSDLTYTFAADAYYDLVAKFEVNNLYPDSGIENTPQSVELSKVDNAYIKNNVSWGSIYATSGSAHSGNAGMDITHRNNPFNILLGGLEQDTDYVFSFWWKFKVTTANMGLDFVKVNGVADGKILKTVAGTISSDEWQQVVVTFNTGANADIKIDIQYTSGSTSCYFDDICLYECNDIQVVAGEGGTASSTMTGPVDTGTMVTVTATETTGRFVGWYNYNNPQEFLSPDKVYTFPVERSLTLLAHFEGEGIDPINYFVDGGFETGNFGGVRFSHPWNSVAACNYLVCEGNTSGTITPRSGNNCLRIDSRGNYGIIQLPNLKPSTDYTLTFYWQGDEGTGINAIAVFPYKREHLPLDQASKGTKTIKYVYDDANKTDVLAMASAYVMGYEYQEDGWQKIQISFNSDSTDENMLHIATVGTNATKHFYLDDITLFEGSSGYSEQLENGDFEDATAENAWQNDYRTVTESGNTYGVATQFKQNMVLDFTEAYTLKFKAKSMTSTPTELIYGFTQGGQDALTTKTALTNVSYDTVTLGTEWEEYELSFSTENYQHYSLYFDALNNAEFALDDVTLEVAKKLAPVYEYTFEDHEYTYPFSNNPLFTGASANNKDWYEFSNEENHSENGNVSLKMKYKDAYASHPLLQNWSEFKLSSGRTYHLSFWAKAKSETKFNAMIETYGDGWIIEKLYNEDLTVGTEWQKYDIYFTVNHIEKWTGVATHFYVNGIDGATTCDIYFDDITLDESEYCVTTTEPENLYTQNLSQNYFYPNYHFEDSTDGITSANTVTGDAFYGEKYLKVNAGDKIIIPFTTRQDWDLKFYAEYTMSAAVRGSGAQGYVGISYSADGNTLMKDKAGNTITLSANTDGEWKHSGFSFAEYSHATLYLVIECTSGSFDVDYISAFNNLRGYSDNTDDLNDYTFDESDPSNFVDASSNVKENFIAGTIEGLPAGSSVILQGKTDTYRANVDAQTGMYEIRSIKDGTYNMLIAAAGNTYYTMWGDITFANGIASGLATERFSGKAMHISGEGVKNGVVKINDDKTGYAYLTATDGDGMWNAYIIDSNWSVVGTTTETKILDAYSLKLKDFSVGTTVTETALNAVSDSEKTQSANATIPVMIIVSVLLASLATLVVYKKKGVNV